MQRQIKFTAVGASSATGSFWPGDTLRCSAEEARHFVEDARCAVYLDSPQPEQPEHPQSDELRRRGRPRKG